MNKFVIVDDTVSPHVFFGGYGATMGQQIWSDYKMVLYDAKNEAEIAMGVMGLKRGRVVPITISL